MTRPLATKELRFREGIQRARSNKTDKQERLKDLLHLESVRARVNVDACT